MVKCDQSDHGARSAFTLVETLAVIVIISMVAGIATVGLAAASDSARLRAAAAQWRDLDARARLFSRSLGPVVMSFEDQSNAVTLHSVGSNELLTAVVLPAEVFGRFRVASPTESIVFDRLGRSVDYDVEVRTNQRVIHWRVWGLTGLISEFKP